ncbi:MAG: divalent-cation tolerance protein CutA [Candidatus Omnitrophica bacterium]|nr:divalent-cation tolerance protein CutA [Candidatus Omnitrophota bacterium]
MFIIIFVTAASKKEAEKIAQALLKNKLCACVNIVDKIESLFWWERKIDRAKEALLIIKSRQDKLDRIVALVKSLHSYTVPEVIAFSITGGNKAYLRWWEESIR